MILNRTVLTKSESTVNVNRAITQINDNLIANERSSVTDSTSSAAPRLVRHLANHLLERFHLTCRKISRNTYIHPVTFIYIYLADVCIYIHNLEYICTCMPVAANVYKSCTPGFFRYRSFVSSARFLLWQTYLDHIIATVG